jgi:ubiquinone/menaquinone biosynthesis C-methylase UbiE
VTSCWSRTRDLAEIVEIAPEGHYQPWIAELRRRIKANGTVLDLGCGCGCGVPIGAISRQYGVRGYRRRSSNVQIRRARELVPSAAFIRADATTVDFPTASFDAVVCLYALIHMPLDEQPPAARGAACLGGEDRRRPTL